MKRIFLIAAVLITTAFIVVMMNWTIVPGSKVNFKINGAFGKDVNGTLTISSSKIIFDPNSIQGSSIAASVNVSSINTHNSKRDKHLLTDDFFDAAKFPVISFQSTSIEMLSKGKFEAKGNLTIKQVTKPVIIPFSFQQKGNQGTFSGTFTINRLDYGVGEKSMLVGNEVIINLNIPVKK